MKTISFQKKIFFKNSLDIENYFGLKGIYIDEGCTVELEGKITLSDNIYFYGKCCLGDGTSVGVGTVLKNVEFGKNNNIREYSIVKNAIFEKENVIGPFCFIRDNTLVGSKCILGNNVEITRSIISNNVKISHQAFLGDVSISDDVIIGAGVVFCNFDGRQNQKSYVNKGSFIGSGTMIISPINIGSNVKIAAGSVVTKNIADNQLYLQKRN